LEHVSMKIPVIAAGSLTAATLLTLGITVGGLGSATAAPGDYSGLAVSPNDVTDSLAYSVGQQTVNPNGQPGVTTVYSHRDNTRQVTNTILILPDPAAATASVNGSRADMSGKVANGKTQPTAVGSDGMTVSGLSPDGSKSVTVLTFAEGNAATSIEFDGPPKDPVPMDLVVEYGQKQDAAIKAGQP
jgi:hypothetical protein